MQHPESTTPAPPPPDLPIPEICLRQPDESARAYAAFATYRDLGPDRSLNKAWRQRGGNKKATRFPQIRGTLSSTRAPGSWTQWSTQFSWKVRAETWDHYWEQRELQARSAEHIRRGIAWTAELCADLEDRLAMLRALRRQLVEQSAAGHTHTRQKTAVRQPDGGAWHTTEHRSRLVDQFRVSEELRQKLFPSKL